MSCPFHLENSGSENSLGRGGRCALEGWAQGTAARVPSSPKCCLSTNCPSGRRVKLLRKGTQGSLLPDPVAFSADSGPLGWSILERVGVGQARGKTLRLGWGAFFLTVCDLGPISAPFKASVYSFDNWDGVTMDAMLERMQRRGRGGVRDGYCLDIPKSVY